MLKYCCSTLELCINEPRVPISYNPIFREYNINSKECQGKIGYRMNVCFWCGKDLPKDVRTEFFDIFYDELKLGDVERSPITKTPGLPEEFKSDEWWKKRGL